MDGSSRNLLIAVPLLSLISVAQMQMSTVPAAQAIAGLPGPPNNPIISAVTPVWQGELQYENKAELKGAVTEAQREEILSTAQNPEPIRRTSSMKFDENGHLIERTYQDAMGKMVTTNTFRDGRLQSQTVDHFPSSEKRPSWQEWQRWSYDSTGRFLDFRAGRDKEEWNHYLNFKYDPSGRPLGYEYRPSGADGPSTFTEIKYVGNTVTTSRLDKDRRKVFEQVQVLDSSKRVVDLKVSDLSKEEVKLRHHVTFKYDEQGRLIEQKTDPYKSGSGDDAAPFPGKVVVRYDDATSSGEQDFYDSEGKLVLRMIAEFDRDGVVTMMRSLDGTGKEAKASVGIFLDPKTHSTRSGNYAWEVAYDDHGNWTERRQWFIPADGGDRITARLIRQTIRYR